MAKKKTFSHLPSGVVLFILRPPAEPVGLVIFFVCASALSSAVTSISPLLSSIQKGVCCGCARNSADSLIHTSTPPPIFIDRKSTPNEVPACSH